MNKLNLLRIHLSNSIHLGEREWPILETILK